MFYTERHGWFSSFFITIFLKVTATPAGCCFDTRCFDRFAPRGEAPGMGYVGAPQLKEDASTAEQLDGVFSLFLFCFQFFFGIYCRCHSVFCFMCWSVL